MSMTKNDSEQKKSTTARTVILCTALALAMILAARSCAERAATIRIEVPASSEVTVCYYIPDADKPYEQIWLGGEKLETALSELAALEFKAADAPDEDSLTACLVIATNDQQITVHVDEAGVCWVYDEERGWRNERGCFVEYPSRMVREDRLGGEDRGGQR